jgi:hypothetical protein
MYIVFFELFRLVFLFSFLFSLLLHVHLEESTTIITPSTCTLYLRKGMTHYQTGHRGPDRMVVGFITT